jgi:uncharacterized protein (TIGR00369 family)
MEHLEKLRRMYLEAPINKFHFPETQIEIASGSATIKLTVNSEYHHAAGGIHGAVLFKLLDDACFFAAQSLEKSYFLLTSNFQIQFVRPVASGILKAEGKVRSAGKQLIICESIILNEKGKEIAFGTGNFLKSSTLLSEKLGY